jgi:hypothetical protein
MNYHVYKWLGLGLLLDIPIEILSNQTGDEAQLTGLPK